MLNGLLKKSWWAQPTLRMLGATAYGVLRYMDDIRRVRCAGSADVPVRMRARRPRSRVQAVRNSPERHVACRARSYKWLTERLGARTSPSACGRDARGPVFKPYATRPKGMSR